MISLTHATFAHQCSLTRCQPTNISKNKKKYNKRLKPLFSVHLVPICKPPVFSRFAKVSTFPVEQRPVLTFSIYFLSSTFSLLACPLFVSPAQFLCLRVFLCCFYIFPIFPFLPCLCIFLFPLSTL